MADPNVNDPFDGGASGSSNTGISLSAILLNDASVTVTGTVTVDLNEWTPLDNGTVPFFPGASPSFPRLAAAQQQATIDVSFSGKGCAM